MKKISLLILGIIIGALATYYFCPRLYQVDETGTDIVKPKGVITPGQAKTLDNAFNSRHRLISDSIVKRPDNRSSWYSLQDMRDYLNYAENQADSLKYTMDGIRVYLGAYPTDKEVGYTTMFFVPTGSPKTSQGSIMNFTLSNSVDIPRGDGFNSGPPGNPPSANYPQ